MEEQKTLKQHLETGAKYAGSSLVIGGAITEIILFSNPALKEIQTAIQVLITFAINLLAIYAIKSIEIK